MSTYVISDIHGQLHAFKKMLNKIDFKFDGTDELHILGDMVDWGKQSIETLIFIKELDDEYDFINVYMGNHEDIMYNHIRTDMNKEQMIDTLWGIRNGGKVTIEQFFELPDEKKLELAHYLKGLRYFEQNLEVNGQKFYLAHSAPFVGDNYDKENYLSPYEHVIWHRLGKHENAFERMDETNREKFKEHIFIYGHTVVHRYDSFDNDKNTVIFKDEIGRKVCIDCGAKMLHDKNRDITFRLACLRLDDMEEFYVER